ncbi:MAG: SRPBCC domain-containing protein [Myxococcaceae bacterium]
MTTPFPKLHSTPVALADVDGTALLARVEIRAPLERVFRAISTDEVTKWWGSPAMYQTTSFTMPLEKGAKWKSAGVGADGSAFHVEGTVLTVDAPRLLVHTWKPSWETGPETTVTWRLDEIPGGTRLSIKHTGFASRESCVAHGEGWERVMGWLGGFANAPDARAAFFVRLIAPRPTFMLDLNDAERAVMKEHSVYWAQKLAEGTVIAYGPVADPKGGWGLGVLRAKDEAEVRAFEAGDPAIKSGRGFRMEVTPMPALIS